jgi:hypothetical protein
MPLIQAGRASTGKWMRIHLQRIDSSRKEPKFFDPGVRNTTPAQQNRIHPHLHLSMNKLIPIALASLAPLSAGFAQTVLFDGSVGTLYKATLDNTNIALTEPTNGNWVLTDNSSLTNTSAVVFGNFAATTLSNDGDKVTLGFRVNNIPNSSNTPLHISLGSARGVALTNADAGFNGFERSYAGSKVTQGINSATNAVRYYAWNGGTAGNLTQDRNLFGAVVSELTPASSTGSGVNRFDGGRTADITFSLVRASATQFRLDYTLNVAGGTGNQTFNSSLYAPSGDFMQLGDALTTFAIGFSGTMDQGTALNLSNLTVTTNVIPEPSTYAALLGVAALGLVVLRRRR